MAEENITKKVVMGKNLFLFEDGVAYGCETDIEATITREMEDIVCKEGNSKHPGNISITGSASGLFAFDAALGAIDAAKTLAGDDSVVIRITTKEADDDYIEFNAFISSVAITAGVTGPSTYSITFDDADGKFETKNWSSDDGGDNGTGT